MHEEEDESNTNLNNIASVYLVKAIKNCSQEVQNAIADEIKDLEGF